jgi:hypothetical protein
MIASRRSAKYDSSVLALWCDLTTNMTRVDVLSHVWQATGPYGPARNGGVFATGKAFFGQLYTPLPSFRGTVEIMVGPFGAPFCCQPRRQTAKPNSHTPATSTARLFAADKVLYRRQRREPNRALIVCRQPRSSSPFPHPWYLYLYS